MKNLTIMFALLVSAFTFAQEKGMYTFGVGTDFTTADNTANVGYFFMDNVMVSLEFEMATESADDAGDDYMDWGIGARYYIGDKGLWAGFSVNSARWSHTECCTTDATCGHTHEHEETGMDMFLGVGCSKVLAWDGKLWFEPYLGINMPAAEMHDGSMHETDAMTLGLGMQFRFAF
ncbi:MAG: hypothetical protein CMP49_00090 [Flavobacteriales bacterium]|nr:hypothetical protein [Flavobacteriales bacterium]|tara:strand:- start:28675 stop:29202 length:528 start_codon:yes stop_codon:yes gene_type:complete